MAEVKKTARASVKKKAEAETAAVEVNPEVKEEAKETAKKTTRKAAVRKSPAKRTTAAKKETAKAEPEEKMEASQETVAQAAGSEEKVEVKAVVNFQFGGKSYSPEDLMKICKDVWKFDLNGKEEDLKSVELYVKPEENITYYVINGDVTGSFFI